MMFVLCWCLLLFVGLERQRELVHTLFAYCSGHPHHALECAPRKKWHCRPSIFNSTFHYTPGKLSSHLMDSSSSRVGNLLKHVLERAKMRHCGGVTEAVYSSTTTVQEQCGIFGKSSPDSVPRVHTAQTKVDRPSSQCSTHVQRRPASAHAGNNSTATALCLHRLSGCATAPATASGSPSCVKPGTLLCEL